MHIKPNPNSEDSDKDVAPLHDTLHYREAGRRVSSVIMPSRDIVQGALNQARLKGSMHPVIPMNHHRYMISNITPDDTPETLGDHYLLPYYEREEHGYLRQEKRMVSSRVSRFFETAQPNIRVTKNSAEIRAAIENYRTTGEGGPILVGSIMDHLDTLSGVIVDFNRPTADHGKVPDEYRDQIIDEFRYFYSFLIFSETVAHTQSTWAELPNECPQPAIEGKKLFDTLRLADGSVDRDGMLFYFAHEVGKLMSVETSSGYAKMNPDERKDARIVMERRTREDATRNVAWACAAIDHVHDSIRHSLITNPAFTGYIKKIDDKIPRDEAGLGASGYGYLFREFTDLARARATVRIKDSDYYKTVDTEFHAATEKLNAMHAAFRELPRLPQDMKDALQLSEQAVALISSMAQSRLPRDHNAPAFAKGQDTKSSSVGLLEHELEKWAKRPHLLATRLGTAAACAFTAKEVQPKKNKPLSHPRIAASSTDGQDSGLAGRG